MRIAGTVPTRGMRCGPIEPPEALRSSPCIKPSDSERPSGRAAKRFRPSPAPAEQGAASLLTAAEGDDESLESWQEPGPYDPAGRLGPWEDRRAAGKAVRRRVPREAHAEWQAPADRPDPVSALLASNEGRQSELLPLRMGR